MKVPVHVVWQDIAILTALGLVAGAAGALLTLTIVGPGDIHVIRTCIEGAA